ncbi:MAG: hypothetical protein RR614_02310 [Eubacterium sp.]
MEKKEKRQQLSAKEFFKEKTVRQGFVTIAGGILIALGGSFILASMWRMVVSLLGIGIAFSGVKSICDFITSRTMPQPKSTLLEEIKKEVNKG